MRYSPSGSHLAIGCKTGTLVIMAIETEGKDGTGENDARAQRKNVYLTEPSDHPLSPGDPVSFNNSEQEEEAGKGDKREPQPSREENAREQKIGRDETPRAPESPNREDLTSSNVGGEQPYWSLRQRSYRRVACLKGHSSRVLHLDWTMDGRFVHTCGQDYQVLHWEIMPPPGRRGDASNTGGDSPAEEFRPRLFQRAFLLRDEHWATWSTSIGWPVQVRDAWEELHAGGLCMVNV